MDRIEPPKVHERGNFHETERRLLFDAFRQRPNKSFILISGPSGCGKTTLAKRLKGHVKQEHDGLFLSGKVDQFHRSNPLLGAIADCVASIKDDTKLHTRLLQDDLRLDLEYLVDSMPVLGELFPLVGAYNKHLDEFGKVNSQERNASGRRLKFKRLFCRFLRALCNELNRPIVLFIDDLQWAKDETRRVLLEIFLDGSIQHLTVVAACREVTQDHQLSLSLRGLDGHGVAIVDVVLSNIAAEGLTRHLSTMLMVSTEEVDHFQVCCFRSPAATTYSSTRSSL